MKKTVNPIPLDASRQKEFEQQKKQIEQQKRIQENKAITAKKKETNLSSLINLFLKDPNKNKVKESMIELLDLAAEKIVLLQKLQARTEAAKPQIIIAMQNERKLSSGINHFLSHNEKEIKKLTKAISSLETKESMKTAKLIEELSKTQLKLKSNKDKKGNYDFAKIIQTATSALSGFFDLNQNEQDVNKKLMNAKEKALSMIDEYDRISKAARARFNNKFESKNEMKTLTDVFHKVQKHTEGNSTHAWNQKTHSSAKPEPVQLKLSHNKTMMGKDHSLNWIALHSLSEKKMDMPSTFNVRNVSMEINYALKLFKNGEEALTVILNKMNHDLGNKARFKGFCVMHEPNAASGVYTLNILGTREGDNKIQRVSLPFNRLQEIILTDAKKNKVDALTVIQSAVGKAVARELEHHGAVVTRPGGSRVNAPVQEAKTPAHRPHPNY